MDSFSNSWRSTFFDIGQGDSILIREPFNRTVCLIDTGGQLHFKTPNWQKRITTTDGAQKISINYLKSIGITTIDAVLLSHSDEDHIGYLKTVCQEMKVRSIIVPSGMEHLTKFTRKIPSDVNVVPVTNDDSFSNIPLKILHPFKKGRGKNEDSMVLYGQFGLKSFIFMGDLNRRGEQQVLQYYPSLKANIIKLGYHGSRTSSDPNFIKQLEPELAIISAGRHNRYGHPNQETLNTLKRENIFSLSTQNKGMIKYCYGNGYGYFKTQLKGDEFNWMH